MVDDDQIKSLYDTRDRRDNRITKDRCKPFTHTWSRISVRYLGTI